MTTSGSRPAKLNCVFLELSLQDESLQTFAAGVSALRCHSLNCRSSLSLSRHCVLQYFQLLQRPGPRQATGSEPPRYSNMPARQRNNNIACVLASVFLHGFGFAIWSCRRTSGRPCRVSLKRHSARPVMHEGFGLVIGMQSSLENRSPSCFF